MKSKKLSRWLAFLLILTIALPTSPGLAIRQAPPDDNPTVAVPPARHFAKFGPDPDEPIERAEWFYAWREAGDPNTPFNIGMAADLRAKAAQQVINEQSRQPNAPQAPSQYTGAWNPIGPNPIVQIARTPDYAFYAVTGRVSALAIRSSPPYTIYLGGAQGGVWVSSTLTNQWIPRTDHLGSLAIGDITLAPSNEDVVYVGTGEGNLSGDSYFGNGLLKSTDGGQNFQHVGGTTFNQVSISRVAVDPTDEDHVYVATLPGVAGSENVRPPFPSPYGIYESTDGGNNWTPRLTTSDRNRGATDLVIDPQNPDVLYAAFFHEGIVKSTDGGVTWHSLMGAFPANADFSLGASRFAIGISHPVSDTQATLYTGFEWFDNAGNFHPATIWKSTDGGATFTESTQQGISGYCGLDPGTSQCSYDNIIGVDPQNPDIVYALGLFSYATGTGGIIRSMDGGQSWQDLGWHMHPDFHAIAIRRDAPNNIVVGNDGGAWSSTNYGGRTNPNDPIDAVDWRNLNGTVVGDAINGGLQVLDRSGLQITQFTGMRQNPTVPGRVYGGTQDNGTLRRSSANDSWFDVASGDGGQVLVDPYNPQYVYGTYPYLDPYRFEDAGLAFYSNISILNGINQTDRSEFYLPFEMDPWYTNRLYIGSYRLYRTDNRGDLWQTISGDLTTGCTNRNLSPTLFACVITAIGVTAGGPQVYVGTGDGLVWLTNDATVATPQWTRIEKSPLPQRPISKIAVDNSNYKVAYIAYSGFNAATPVAPGHVFSTKDGGQTWTDISGNLPDVPVNAIKIDPSTPGTLYASTDVGPMVTYDDGANWQPLGTDFPIVAVSEIDINPFTGLLRAGTYGRGAWEMTTTTQEPALQIRKESSAIPAGPNTPISYTISIRNTGNLTATNVVVTDTIPANTQFVSASDGGTLNGNVVTWTIPQVPMGYQAESTFGTFVPGSASVSLTVRVNPDQATGNLITNSLFGVSSAEGVGATGSPQVVTLAPANDLLLSPASQFDGARVGQTITYTESIQNMGYLSDTYNLSVSGNRWPTTLWDPTFTSMISTTPSVSPGLTYTFGVRVSVPLTATNGLTDTAVVQATSQANPAKSATATITTRAVAVDILLVDDDAFGTPQPPDAQTYYRQALDTAGYKYDVWDLEQQPEIPPHFLQAHKAVIWFTGGSYPGPLLPYESTLASYLDNGGRLFLSGQDLLDQAAGTTDFVRNYLHVDWNGTEIQNDKPITPTITGVPTNTLTANLGPYTMDFDAVGLPDYSDLLTPIPPAEAAFQDAVGIRGLTVSADNYKIWFLAFPFEAMGTNADRAEVLKAALRDFGVSLNQNIYLPFIGINTTP